MPQFFHNANYKFVVHRYRTATISGVVILAGIIAMIIRGPNWSVDFRGGLDMTVRFAQPLSESQVRDAFGGIEIGEVKTIGRLGQQSDILIRTKVTENSDATQKQIKERLDRTFPGNPVEIRNVSMVGPRVGRELRNSAILSGIIAVGLLLIYISWRFRFEFAIGGIIALVHNVGVTLAFLVFFNYELSLAVLAAFLTLIGYSINDTIVVFDRIRENMKKLRNMSMGEIMDLSINETLSRSVITSVTVFLTTLVLYVFGGEVLRGFAFVMLVGVIASAYATVFVSAPVVVEWAEKAVLKGKKR
ncbi:protein translocase subunit SecF [candidate division KSB1 bacterium]|nr:protein translocase subunit SecF [candidate division KSB1 bacterium]